MSSTLAIVQALQVISQAALSYDQVKTLLESEEITEEAVGEALNNTDQTIRDLKDDD